MSTWPPPPDLASLKELFAIADIEGLIADDCPLDEYDPEAKHFYEATLGWPNSKFTEEKTIPVIKELWVKQFMLNDEQLAQRTPAIAELASQIARFFGPEAQPQTRSAERA
jgi:hypothetical protein